MEADAKGEPPMKVAFLTYGVLAGLTPTLVFANSLLVSTAPKPLHLFRSMSLANSLMISEPIKLKMADEQSRILSPEKAAQASIVEENGQLFLEFFQSVNLAAQTPQLTLVLDTQAEPHEVLIEDSDRNLAIGQLEKKAGNHRYRLPNSVNTHNYLSVVIWSPELNVILGYMPIVTSLDSQSFQQEKLQPQ